MCLEPPGVVCLKALWCSVCLEAPVWDFACPVEGEVFPCCTVDAYSKVVMTVAYVKRRENTEACVKRRETHSVQMWGQN